MIGKRVLGILGAVSLLAWFGLIASAQAQPVIGVPHDWQMGFPASFTPVMDKVAQLHDLLLVIISLISAFVLILLLYVMWRFHASRHPVPSTVTHNTVLEILWTILPILILVVIAVPSFRLLYYGDKAQDAAMTVKVTGHQWYWSYEYPDQGGVAFDSNMIPEEDAAKLHKKRLLDVDFPVVLPVNTSIRILVSGVDVIHSWFVPSFGVQEYAVIGRTNESWVKIDREGTFYGQCNQICGVNHPFMPIEVKAVSSDKFKTWSACAKAAGNDQARAACYAPLETADSDETEMDSARVAANAPASDVVK
jgi:cytochrome c oxidase subunit 2